MADREELPKIVGVAVRVMVPARHGQSAGKVLFSLPRPLRHHHLLHTMTALGLDAAVLGGPEAQGFLTSSGEFLGREGALQLARDNGQFAHAVHDSSLLFSEDLW